LLIRLGHVIESGELYLTDGFVFDILQLGAFGQVEIL
jgi:hypothetical protein